MTDDLARLDATLKLFPPGLIIDSGLVPARAAWCVGQTRAKPFRTLFWERTLARRKHASGSPWRVARAPSSLPQHLRVRSQRQETRKATSRISLGIALEPKTRNP